VLFRGRQPVAHREFHQPGDIGKPAQLITPPDRAGNFAHLLERVQRGEAVPPYDTERRRKDGSRFHAQVSLSAIKDDDGRVAGISTIVRDITERQRAEENLRALALRLSQVEESERRNIHRELHDQIGACLATLKIDLDLLKKQLPPDDEKAARRLEQMRQMTGETIRRIRDVMADLRPPGPRRLRPARCPAQPCRGPCRTHGHSGDGQRRRHPAAPVEHC